MKIVNIVQKYSPPHGGATSALLTPTSVPLPQARETGPPLPFFRLLFPVPGMPPPHLLGGLLLLLELSWEPSAQQSLAGPQPDSSPRG